MSDVDYSADVSADTSAAPSDGDIGVAAPDSGNDSPPVSESVNSDPDALLKDVWKEMNGEGEGRHRDEYGRFARRENDQAQATDQGQAQSATQPPQFWSAEAKAAWNQVPPALQQEIAQRDMEVQQFISRQGQEIGEYRQYANLWEHRCRDAFNSWGMDDNQAHDVVSDYVSHYFQDPIGAIVRLANADGIDLYQALGVTPQHGVSPDLAALYSEVNGLKHQLTQREQAEQHARLSAFEQQVVEFSQDKPDFETVAPYMVPWIDAIRAEHPNASPQEVLQWAYDSATWALPATREQRLKEQTEAQERARIQEAQQRARQARNGQALHVASSPANSPTPKSQDDLLKETWRKMNA